MVDGPREVRRKGGSRSEEWVGVDGLLRFVEERVRNYVWEVWRCSENLDE